MFKNLEFMKIRAKRAVALASVASSPTSSPKRTRSRSNSASSPSKKYAGKNFLRSNFFYLRHKKLKDEFGILRSNEKDVISEDTPSAGQFVQDLTSTVQDSWDQDMKKAVGPVVKKSTPKKVNKFHRKIF